MPDGSTVLNESTLLSLAESWVAEHDPDGEPLPKVLGFATTRPEMLPGDRSTVGQSAQSDDYYVSPQTVQKRRLARAMGLAAIMSDGGRYARTESPTAWRYVTDREPSAVDGELGRIIWQGWRRVELAESRKVRTFTRGWRDVDDDEPTLRPASLCAVSHDDMASALGIDPQSFLNWYAQGIGRSNDTDIADSWRRRTVIPRRGCLGPAARKRADIAVLSDEMKDERGRKHRQVLGRRLADRTELVTFADKGYFLGHTFVVTDTALQAKRDVQATALAAAKVLAASRAETRPDVNPFRQALDAIAAMQAGDRIGDVTCDAPGHYSRNGVRCQTPAIAARHALRAMADS
jgi:hypothetical protein